MQAIGEYLDSHLDSVRKLTKIFIVSIFAIQVLVVFSQVIWRFVFNNPFSWSEELARYLQVWLILLTSAVCIRKGRHLAVDYLTHVLPFKLTKILMFVSLVFSLIFSGVIVIFGIELIVVTIHQITPALQVPIAAVYLAFPICGFLMLLEGLVLFFKLDGVKDKADLKMFKDTRKKDKGAAQ